MANYLFQFRELYFQLLNVESGGVAPLLTRWADSNRAILEPYRKFQHPNVGGNSYVVEGGGAHYSELESLYALSRVCDTLSLPFQSGECWFDLSPSQFVEFWQTLGIATREVSAYHPFWCEIVQCENGADDAATPRIEEIFWPALLWGDLLICRAGVRVCAGRNWMQADVAASSPLYFASRRNYRMAHDLSHGWGSNSQWGTDFRRDYVWGEHYIFNVDGERNWDEPFLQALSAHEWAESLIASRQFFASDKGDNGDLTLAEREELLVNRCLIHRAKTEMDDFWPYDDVAVWQQKAPLQRV